MTTLLLTLEHEPSLKSTPLHALPAKKVGDISIT